MKRLGLYIAIGIFLYMLYLNDATAMWITAEVLLVAAALDVRLDQFQERVAETGVGEADEQRRGPAPPEEWEEVRRIMRERTKTEISYKDYTLT